MSYRTDARVVHEEDPLARLGLELGRYLLYVSRLEPENNAHIVMHGYIASGIDLPLAIVRDAPYAADYKHSLAKRAAAHPGIRTTGDVFGEGYAALQSNAALNLEATEVGGTHPALVEAMGRGVCIVANDGPEHREVLGDAGRHHAQDHATDMAAVLRDLDDDPAGRAELGAAAGAWAQAAFSRDHATDECERLLAGLIRRRIDG